MRALLSQSRARNHALSITGLLVYDRGDFFQWLEGPGPALFNVWQSILRDRRHFDICLLGVHSIPMRLFSAWDMQLACRGTLVNSGGDLALAMPDVVLDCLHHDAGPHASAWRDFAALLAPIAPAPANHAANDVVIDDALDIIAALTAAVMSTVANAAPRLVEMLRARGLSAETLCVNVFELVARRLGDLFRDDACQDADVTLGMYRLQALVRQLSTSFSVDTNMLTRSYSVLVAPQPGESHMLRAAIDSEFFNRQHWHVVCDFPSTNRELNRLLCDHWFDVLDLSLSSAVTQEHRLFEMASTIASARQASSNPALVVMVGGRVFAEHPEYRTLVGADTCSGSTILKQGQFVQQAESLLYAIKQPAFLAARDALNRAMLHVAQAMSQHRAADIAPARETTR
jgi:hypothetical protein